MRGGTGTGPLLTSTGTGTTIVSAGSTAKTGAAKAMKTNGAIRKWIRLRRIGLPPSNSEYSPILGLFGQIATYTLKPGKPNT